MTTAQTPNATPATQGAQLVLFPKGSISANDKGRMAKAGFLAVECDDPAKVVISIPGVPLATSDDMLMAAMEGVAHGFSDGPRDKFFRGLHRRMQAREKKA